MKLAALIIASSFTLSMNVVYAGTAAPPSSTAINDPNSSATEAAAATGVGGTAEVLAQGQVATAVLPSSAALNGSNSSATEAAVATGVGGAAEVLAQGQDATAVLPSSAALNGSNSSATEAAAATGVGGSAEVLTQGQDVAVAPPSSAALNGSNSSATEAVIATGVGGAAEALAQGQVATAVLPSSAALNGSNSSATEAAVATGVGGAAEVLAQGQEQEGNEIGNQSSAPEPKTAKLAKTEQQVLAEGRTKGAITALWAGLATGAFGGPVLAAVFGGAVLDSLIQHANAKAENVVLSVEGKELALIEGGAIAAVGWKVMPRTGGSAPAGAAAPAHAEEPVEELAELAVD